MKIDRRKFLAGTAFTATGGLIAQLPRARAERKDKTAAIVSARLNIRDEFSLSRDYIHLATFFLSSHPRVVRQAIERYRKMLDDNPLLVVENGMFSPGDNNLAFKVVQTAAEYFEAKPEQFAITQSTTMGLALVYSGLKIKKGQEILTTVHDHYSHHESIRLAAEKNGATMKKIALFENFDAISEDSISSRIRAAVQPKTRAIGVTWVHSSSGVKLPIRAIAEIVAEMNKGRDESDRILLIVDGVHALGIENETVSSIGCDFLCAGTHKWLWGPRGTGIIWGSDWAWSQLIPTIPSFYDNECYTAWMENRTPKQPVRASWVSPGGFHAFEHEWAVADAFRYHMQLGKKNIQQQIHAFNTQCKEALSKMQHVKLYTPMSDKLSSGIVCFDVAGMQPHAVVEKLLQKKIVASVTPYGTAYARLAPSLINNPQEIETTAKAIRELT